ncbi:MAG: hypothetical protein PHY28_04335 [Dehalococcoidales bacterium]|nr:hypothetical protein [Dehalococcoidales bacterium]
MNKVQSVIPGTSEYQGKSTPVWDIACQMTDGTMRGARSYRELKAGDVLEDDDFKRNKKGDGWVIWGEKKGSGGKSWPPKDDNIIVAQCAAKMVCDLVIAGKINPVKMADYQENFIIMAKAIKATAAAIKDPAPATKPATTSAAPAAKAAPLTGETAGIKNMGMLRLAIGKEYPTLKTTAAQDKVLGPDPITDFDAAFQKVKDYMEGLKI